MSDSYADIALVYAGFQCHQCPEYFHSDEGMAEKAKELGWYVDIVVKDGYWEEDTVLCPVCARLLPDFDQPTL